MKFSIKYWLVTISAFLVLGHVPMVSADLNSDTEKLLNWAETTYPNYFPTHQITQSIDPWLFRYYPDSKIYAGVNKTNNDVYVLGGPWGDTPARIASLAELMAQVPVDPGNDTACDTTSVPQGMAYSQNGNVINITTNGCIPLPENSNVCETPQQPAATGISVLTTMTTNAPPAFAGITISDPSIAQAFQPMLSAFTSSKHCVVHVPAESANLVVNTNVCFDMTSALQDLAGVPGVTITPPVTMALNNTTSSVTVPDCFATDASTIYNAVTNETWINQNGTFVNVTSKR